MEDKDLWRLRHMIENTNLILHFGEGCTTEDLQNDIQLSLSLIKLFEIIGEAANHISSDVQELAPEIPWGDVIATRNKLIHEYFNIDFAIISQTVNLDIPDLIPKLLELEEKISTRSKE